MLSISKPDSVLTGEIVLEGSKSLSNRALIILSLAGADPELWLSNLSGARDTRILLDLLHQAGHTYNAGDAGTVFRFLTAYLALQPGEKMLTGSPRMLERPIGALVDALRALGADVRYAGRENYPPLLIGHRPLRGGSVAIDAGVSSQFLSALLMVAPYFENGLLLEPRGRLVSRPYLDMTLKMMRFFGAEVAWENENIRVQPGIYQPRPLVIEADWSAASYWYSMAGMAQSADISLRGLFADSLQGDSVLTKIGAHFGIETSFYEGGIRLQHNKKPLTRQFEWNFSDCPDIAQSIAVLCAGRGVAARFSGLETLSIKETDRISALQQELHKIGVRFSAVNPDSPDYEQVFRLEGKADFGTKTPTFATYGDHRMAMSFAPLALLGPICIEHPEVVNKSYPRFWDHLEIMGFRLLGC